MTTTDLYANYRLTNVREMGGFETIAYTGVLTHNGKKIAEAYNAGTGGGTILRFYDGHYTKAEKDFYATAAKIIQADIEPEEEFLGRLLTVASLNRKRSVLMTFDGDDFWETGTYRTISATTASRSEIIAHVTRMHADRNPRFWHKDRGDFVPADELS